MTPRKINFALKAATRQLIDENGGQSYAAEQTRVPQSVLSEYASNTKPDRFIAADVILDLDLATGNPVVTRELAEQQNYWLVPMAVIANGAGISACAVKLQEAFGPLMEEVIKTLADGRTDPDEIRRLEALARPMARAMAEFTGALQAQGGGA